MRGTKVELRSPIMSDNEYYYIWRNDDEVSYWATGRAPWFTEVSLEQLNIFLEKNNN